MDALLVCLDKWFRHGVLSPQIRADILDEVATISRRRGNLVPSVRELKMEHVEDDTTLAKVYPVKVKYVDNRSWWVLSGHPDAFTVYANFSQPSFAGIQVCLEERGFRARRDGDSYLNVSNPFPPSEELVKAAEAAALTNPLLF
jgi:hypothetical protein